MKSEFANKIAVPSICLLAVRKIKIRGNSQTRKVRESKRHAYDASGGDAIVAQKIISAWKIQSCELRKTKAGIRDFQESAGSLRKQTSAAEIRHRGREKATKRCAWCGTWPALAPHYSDCIIWATSKRTFVRRSEQLIWIHTEKNLAVRRYCVQYISATSTQRDGYPSSRTATVLDYGLRDLTMSGAYTAGGASGDAKRREAWHYGTGAVPHRGVTFARRFAYLPYW